jgi:hypothetical protein
MATLMPEARAIIMAGIVIVKLDLSTLH